MTDDPRLTPIPFDTAYQDDTVRAAAVAAVRHGQPDATATDPVALGWMQGFPPPPELRVQLDTTDNRFPRSRWAFSHVRELRPTVAVWRGHGPVRVLPRADTDLDATIGALRYTAATGEVLSVADTHGLTYTDGLVVLHEGRIVHERYFGALDDHTPHLAMSVTKSFIGTLAAWFIHEGAIDATRTIPHYLPELANTGWHDATFRQVLDMTAGVAYTEDYTDPASGFLDYARAAGFAPTPRTLEPRDVAAYLPTIRAAEPHDSVFVYRTVHTEVLAWILRRVSSTTIAKLLSERIWQKLGAEADAYFMLDSCGQEACGGGLNTTLRDLARFGELMRNDGAVGGTQVMPAAVVADIRRGGDRTRFADGDGSHYPMMRGGSYANQWWMAHDSHGVYEGRGIHGQRLHIDPLADMTIARYASHPFAASSGNDPYTMPAFRAIADFLRR